MGEDAIAAFTRVLGAAATNIAEAAVALFYAELGPGTEREGSDELARARCRTRDAGLTTVPEALSRVLVAESGRAARRALLSRGGPSSTGSGAGGRGGRRGGREPRSMALGFVDLVGIHRVG